MPPKPRTTAINRLLKNIDADVKKLRLMSAAPSGHLKGVAGNDLYEAYLFMRVLSAARRKGVTLQLLGEKSNNSAQQMIFRRSPGTLHHASGKAPDYTFALLTPLARRPRRALFVGIEAQGYSGVTHECDLLLLPLSEARNAQSLSNYRLWRRADLYVEAKFHATEITLLAARTLIGVHADLCFEAVVLACHDDLAANAETYLKAGPWRPTAAGFGRVRPGSWGHKQLEDHLVTLF